MSIDFLNNFCTIFAEFSTGPTCINNVFFKKPRLKNLVGGCNVFCVVIKAKNMISKIHSVVPCGFDGKLVDVEGDINRGLPALNIVGMANKTINEAKERVKSAIINSGFSFPDKKITINLAPADILKDGSYLDLPIIWIYQLHSQFWCFLGSFYLLTRKTSYLWANYRWMGRFGR